MKVLFLSAWYPHRNDPMSGLFVRKHAEAVAMYANVAVLYVVLDKNCTKPQMVSSAINGITEFVVYFPLPTSSYSYRLFVLINFVKAYLFGFKILHKAWGKPNVVQVSVLTRNAAIAYLYKLRYNIPYLVIEHWTRYFQPNTFQNYFHKKITQFVVRNASKILPVTMHLKTSMEYHSLKNKNYSIINNVVDKVFFRNQALISNEIKNIISVTCFDDEQKNLSGMLRVIQKLYAVRSDFKLTLIGTGIDFEKIKTQAVEMNLLNKAVFFTGMLQGENLVDAYYNCNFSILFSNHENIPVVISESLVCGKPVISTNVGGISEHIDASNGILIEANDEDALLKVLNQMLDNYDLYNSKLIGENAATKYSSEYIGNELFNHYKSVVSK